MALSDSFIGFLLSVGVGSAAVLLVMFVVRLKTPRRAPAFINRKNPR
jgi:hypothetical protein